MKLFDLHCDTLYECCETGRRLRENDLHVNRAAARKYRHYAQFFALFCGARAPPETLARERDCCLTRRRTAAWNVCWKPRGASSRIMRIGCRFCRSADDLAEAARDGKAAAFLSIEGAELLPDRPNALDNAYEAGVRLLTVTWNYRSRFGCPATLDQEEGLTNAGRGAGARLCGQGDHR